MTLALTATMRGLAACWVLALSPCVSAAPAALGGSPYELIVAKLADTRTFRMTSEEFDTLVAPYCKKTSSDIDAVDNLAEYSCAKDSGINDIKIGERKNNKQAGTFILYLSMSLSPASYAPLKTQMEKQLGRPAKSGKDFQSWSYTADKKLNTIGSPVISLTRDAKENNTSFGLGVEAGP